MLVFLKLQKWLSYVKHWYKGVFFFSFCAFFIYPLLSAPIGSGVKYNSVSSPSLKLTTFTIPVVLPLEAEYKKFQFGSSIQYTKSEYQNKQKKGVVEGARYFSLDSRFLMSPASRLKFELSESLNIPLGQDREYDSLGLLEMNANNYILNTNLNMSYFFDRMLIEFGLAHSWKFANKEYDPGETIEAGLIMGFGFGGLSSDLISKQIYLTLGLTSNYHYADRINRETVFGTEYGTVFIAPGLRINQDSLSVWAAIEVPILHYTPEEESYKSGLRGNIGMKYYLW